MGHPDFRRGKKIFATLWYPSEELAMVKLTREQQEAITAEYPAMFRPVSGGWGLRGATHVVLRSAKVKPVRLALVAAWENVQASSARPRSSRRK